MSSPYKRLVTVAGIVWRVSRDPGDRDTPPDTEIEFVEIEDAEETAACMIAHIWDELATEAEQDEN